MPTYMKNMSFAHTKRTYDKYPAAEGGGWNTCLLGLKAKYSGISWRDLKRKYDALQAVKAMDHLTPMERELLTALRLDLEENLEFAEKAGFDGIEGKDSNETL